ncbi:MAG: N-acetylneuraminate synthase family protein, partial [Crocosphaera sp.]
MLIDRNLSKYIVFSEDSILNALKKISDNKSRIIFSVTESGVLEGVLTDGDLRRWLVEQNTIDLNQAVFQVSNKQFKYASFEEDPEKINGYFSEQIEFIPLLDDNDRLVAIARKRPDEIKIGDFIINNESPTFIIAEIGNNHNGSLDLAKKLIDEAIAAGANCAKFQLRSLKSLYHNAGNADDASEDLGSQYTLDLLSRFQLSDEEMLEAFDYCKQKGVLPLCTPWDLNSLNILENYGMVGYKVASADLTNHELLKALAKTGKPLICSTGMSTEAEISESVQLLQKLGAMYVLLHCNSTYPAPFKDVNLNYISRLKELGDCPVGYSGHERGINVAIAAVSQGAKVIEKHFTLDKSMEGNDHKVSLLPQEFKDMVEGIRQVEEALGTSSERQLSQGELMNRETLAKSLIINCDLEPGEVITEAMIEVKSPGKGLQPNRQKELIGKTAKRSFKVGDFFFASDLEEAQITPKNYQFGRPWGLPVRYHDFTKLLIKSNPNLLEFHLSYKDLEQDIEQYFAHPYDLDYVVHSPELFAGDHVLDLCSSDEEYRQHSIQELQRVIDITRELKPYFKKASRPLIVTNIGGFTLDEALPINQRQKYYDLLLDSLSKLDQEGVEIIPQTMPPFPWHFGGQRYHNLFVDPQDIAEFCSQHNYRVCLDTSHSKLACNHHHLSFKEFIEQVGPYTAHLHIADAQGL